MKFDKFMSGTPYKCVMTHEYVISGVVLVYVGRLVHHCIQNITCEAVIT